MFGKTTKCKGKKIGNPPCARQAAKSHTAAFSEAKSQPNTQDRVYGVLREAARPMILETTEQPRTASADRRWALRVHIGEIGCGHPCIAAVQATAYTNTDGNPTITVRICRIMDLYGGDLPLETSMPTRNRITEIVKAEIRNIIGNQKP